MPVRHCDLQQMLTGVGWWSGIVCNSVICTVFGATEHVNAVGTQRRALLRAGVVEGGLLGTWGLKETLRPYGILIHRKERVKYSNEIELPFREKLNNHER